MVMPKSKEISINKIWIDSYNDVNSAIEELKSKNVKIYRDIQEREAGKNAIVLDPDDYMISLFEPNFSSEKHEQTGGYVGFTPQ